MDSLNKIASVPLKMKPTLKRLIQGEYSLPGKWVFTARDSLMLYAKPF
jgi:hypothetical protein